MSTLDTYLTLEDKTKMFGIVLPSESGEKGLAAAVHGESAERRVFNLSEGNCSCHQH